VLPPSDEFDGGVLRDLRMTYQTMSPANTKGEANKNATAQKMSATIPKAKASANPAATNANAVMTQAARMVRIEFPNKPSTAISKSPREIIALPVSAENCAPMSTNMLTTSAQMINAAITFPMIFKVLFMLSPMCVFETDATICLFACAENSLATDRG
jgi:hypothetical protein